jgi:hypothetical protein
MEKVIFKYPYYVVHCSEYTGVASDEMPYFNPQQPFHIGFPEIECINSTIGPVFVLGSFQ